jgi:threonyl-tRNA synthetase
MRSAVSRTKNIEVERAYFQNEFFFFLFPKVNFECKLKFKDMEEMAAIKFDEGMLLVKFRVRRKTT